MNDTTTKILKVVLNADSADDIMNAKEAAVALGIQHRSVLKAISRKTLHAVKVGSMWYMTKRDVDKYKNEYQNGASDDDNNDG